MGRRIYINVELTEETLKRLKEKSGVTTTKDALSEAVTHYLECFMSKEESKVAKRSREKRGGRNPIYLTPIFERNVMEED